MFGKKARYVLRTLMLIAVILMPNPLKAGETARPEGPVVEERLGVTILEGIVFKDERGADADLKKLIEGRPAILSFAYFSCQNLCTTLLGNLSGTLGRLEDPPGKGYSVITISLDASDTPEKALQRKRDFVLPGGPIPDEGWRFLTGSGEAIKKITSLAGYGFRKLEKEIDHPGVLVVISPEGKVVRYIYGSTYLPSELKLALIDAASGKEAASVPKALAFCYTYDPVKKTYTLNIMRVAGAVTLASMAAFFLYLASAKKGKRFE